MSQQISTLRINIFSCSYNSLYWLDDPMSLKNDMLDVLSNLSNFTYDELAIHNVRNATNKNIEIHINGCQQNSTAELTSAQIDQLRSDLIAELNDSGNFSYTFSYGNTDIISDRYYDNPSDGHIGFTLDQEDPSDEIATYIKGVQYNASAWNSDVENNIFAQVDLALRELDSLEFGDLNVYQSHAFVTSSENVYEAMMIFFKKATYNSNGYISDTDSATLRTNIMTQLNTVDNLTYSDVELRVSRKY